MSKLVREYKILQRECKDEYEFFYLTNIHQQYRTHSLSDHLLSVIMGCAESRFDEMPVTGSPGGLKVLPGSER